jgi:hypothetical protein
MNTPTRAGAAEPEPSEHNEAMADLDGEFELPTYTLEDESASAYGDMLSALSASSIAGSERGGASPENTVNSRPGTGPRRWTTIGEC